MSVILHESAVLCVAGDEYDSIIASDAPNKQ